MLRDLLNWNIALSKRLDMILPEGLRRDGNRTFHSEFLPRAVNQGDIVYELGGGSQPFLSHEEKTRLEAIVVGLDVDGNELSAAPPGIYDRMIIADLCTYHGESEADVVICQAALEHVPDGGGAMHGIATSLRPGGRAFIFAPSRNAAFARLNLILPQKLKQRLLFTIFPKKAEGHDGFRAFYDKCTPSQIEALAVQNGLLVEERQLFWTSSYFFIFTPAFLLWRIYQGLMYLFVGDDAAETFIYVLRKDPNITIENS